MRGHLGVVILIVTLALAASMPSSAANATASARFDAADVAVGALRSYQTVSIEGLGTMSAVGSPELPVRVLRFVIPADASVEEVVVGHAFEEELPGTYMLAPKQPEAPIGETVEWVGPDAAVYETPGLYPSERVTYLGDGYLGGYRIASVAVYPLQYEPTTGKLVAATDVSVELVLGSGADRSTRRSRVTPRSDELYRSLVEGLVENPEDVLSCRGSVEVTGELGVEGYSPRYTPSLDGSPVEYLIVTSEELEPYFQPLAEWKTQKGVPAAIRTVSWIEANYPGGCDTAERIRLFLKDAYASWGTTYVLLGGDTQVVPVRYAQTSYYSGAAIPCDLYYSDLDGNWNDDGDLEFGETYKSHLDPGDSLDLYPDVFVGRAPVSTSAQVETFVDKAEAYVKTPGVTATDRNLYLAEVLFPYDWESGTYSLDGAANITEPALAYVPGHIHNTKLYANYGEFPDSHPLNSTSALDSLDQGYGVVVHVGHGNKDILRVSYDNYLSMYDMSSLSNGFDKSSFMWMLDCTSTAIDYDCISERAVNCATGGAVGLFGPTRYAFPATSRDYLWDWFDIFYSGAEYEAGVVCAMSKAVHASPGESGADNTDRWTQFTTVYLGDPALPLWSGRPTSMTVNHAGAMQVGDTGLLVTVTDPSPVDGALVCAYREGEIYEYDYTGPTGEVTLDVEPDVTGVFTVTVTAAGHIPYEGNVNVTMASDAHLYLESVSVDDDPLGSSVGNDNAKAESGETIELDVVVKNSGVLTASGVSATLGTSDGYISLADSTESLGDITAGDTASAAEAFRFIVSASCPNEHDVTFTLDLTEGARLAWSETFTVRIYRPELRQLYLAIDDSAGNGNGVPEVGETVGLSIEVENGGNGDAGGVTGKLRYPGGAVSVGDSTDTWGTLEAGEVAPGTGGFEFTVSSEIISHFRLLLSDERGGSWSSYIDLDPPAAPDSIGGRVKGTTINVAWTPGTDSDLFGYNVYRSEDEFGTYELANGAPVQGIAYFADSGLSENTPYFYYVVAVDSSGNVSGHSPTLAISTNPPSMVGWPLNTGGGMYSSPAVADVDGDGDQEIIIASDHVYVWHHDGTELIDGDGDPRSGGVFETDGVGGYRASVAVGEVDGDPGLEIVAPAWEDVGTPEYPAYEVYAWNAEDGSVLSGWPVTTTRFCWGSPVIADLDHDGRGEVLAPGADRRLYCWKYNGSEYIDGDSDPSTVGVFADIGGSWAYASPAVADIDGDRELEIIQPSTNDSVYCYNADGSRVPGWPVYVEDRVETSPSVGDVDQDGDLEIVVSSNSLRVWLFEADGTLMSGWPKAADIIGDNPASPILADVKGDGYLEIIQSGTYGEVSMWNYMGQSLSGWPQSLGGNAHSSPIVCDIDGFAGMEVVVGCDNGMLYAFDSDGNGLDGWPIQTDAELFGSPAAHDLDNDGDIEVIIGGMDSKVYVWDCDGLYDDGAGIEWGCFLHDAWRTQSYDYEIPVDVPEDGDPWGAAAGVSLAQNVPNPFNPVTTIAFSVPGSGPVPVRLAVYDVRGSLVRVLVDGVVEPGRRTVSWDGVDSGGRPVSSGVYFYKLTTGSDSARRKMTLLK